MSKCSDSREILDCAQGEAANLAGFPGLDGGKFYEKEPSASPFANHQAFRNFQEIYTGRQRKDSKKWLDYFTSDDFLDVAWEENFTVLLLEHVSRLEKEYPVNREFLNWLCAAYQFTVHQMVYLNPDNTERTEYQFQLKPGAEFQGQEAVFLIATKGPAPRRLKGNELAVSISFTEYRYLLSMAKKNVWSEQEVGECSRIISYYESRYITDKCQQRGDMDYERHPAGLRLLTHFFRREGLPEELYRIVWRRLNLETVLMGRAKIFYGALRELVLEKLPELAGQQREKYVDLRAYFHSYAVSTCKIRGDNAQASQEDVQRTDELFAREDFQRALRDRYFVEEEMLHTWVHEDRCDYYLRRIIQFYTEHESVPCARKVIDRATEMLKYQKLASRLKKDREAKASGNVMTLKNSAFFRHWLNTGFYQARDPESGSILLNYLSQELPYLPEWSRKFLQVTGENITPKSVTCGLGEDSLEVRFHLRYMEFLLNQEPVYRPCLEWDRVAGLADTDTFFFCLPVAVTGCDQFEMVKGEVLHRLEDTAAPENGWELIAACLAGQVCRLPLPGEVDLEDKRESLWSEEDGDEEKDWDEEEHSDEEKDWDGEENSDEDWDEEGLDEDQKQDLLDMSTLPPESELPFELFAEDTEHLYGCSWVERKQLLMLFEQKPIGRQLLLDGLYSSVADAQCAVAMAQQLLEETVTPPCFPMESLTNLPDAVYAMPDFYVVSREKDAPACWSSSEELLGEAVTSDRLEELLTRFAGGQLERLEFSWKAQVPIGEEQDYGAWRSLVFMKGSGGYVCLYFDDFRAKSFALLERPDLYGKRDTRPELVPFHQSKLFQDVIHQSFFSIRRQLDVIFCQVSWPNNVDFMADGIWDYAVNVSHGRSSYNLDKQLLGDFPMERACNRLDAAFYFYLYPQSVAYVDEQGSVEAMEVSEAKRMRLQRMMTDFLKGGFRKLRLTFGREAGERWHIVLLQDGGRFLMAWLQEEKKTVKYHVADVGIYMDVEGKKYPKDTFQGRITPAYLIHDGVVPLRNALELLLVNLDEPTRITEKFAEYANEKPVKARSYEVLWEELVGDTLEGQNTV